MGFGVLFIGYITSYLLRLGMGTYGFAAIMLGQFIMFRALSKLKDYNGRFAAVQYATVPMLLISAWMAFSQINDMFLLNLTLDTVNTVIEPLRYLLEAAQHILMFAAIASLANEVGLPRHVSLARTGIAGTSVLYLYAFGVCFAGIFAGESADIKFLTSLEIVLYLICFIFSAVLIFYCYMYICPEGDENMEIRPSRFAFINRMREKRNARDEKAAEETAQWVERLKRERENKKKNKRKKK